MEKNEKISPRDATKKLVSRNENGEYEIGNLNGPEERKSLTEVVRILSQVDLKNEDPKEWQVLRNGLGMIGAFDKYGFLGKENSIKSTQLPQLAKSGNKEVGILYIRNFLSAKTAFDRAFIEDVFNEGVISDWLDASDRLAGENSRKNGELEEAAKTFDEEVTHEERENAGDAIKDVREEEQIVVEAENVKSDEGK